MGWVGECIYVCVCVGGGIYVKGRGRCKGRGTYRRWGIIIGAEMGGCGGGGYVCVLSKGDMLRGGGDNVRAKV